MKRLALGAWRGRWGLARLAVASFLLWAIAADSGARLSRLALAALPDFDYLAEVRSLRERGRFGEALVVAEAGLGATTGETQVSLLRERQATKDQQASTLRRITDAGRGALTGLGGVGGTEGPEASLEAVLGAVAADLFVVGDVRDLLVQATRYARGGGRETDPVIVALSAVGLATTLAPQVDWAPSILKAARKAGALSGRLGEFVLRAARARRIDDLQPLLTDVGTLARHASPAGAVRLLRHADDPADAARLARFLGRSGANGAFALHVTGRHGAEALRSADRLRDAGRLDDALALEATVLKAAAKGPRGAAWLAGGWPRALLRPHPLVGALKSLWKGNAALLIQRALERLDPNAWWVVPALAAWAFIECGLLLRRWGFAARGPVASARPALA